ncbi:MAG: N-acetylmuramoyl-L-alanine amidase, partial [Planctomycetota bacterium]
MSVADTVGFAGRLPLLRPAVFAVVGLLLIGLLAVEAEANSRAGPCPVQTPGPTTLPEPEVTFIPSPSFGQRNALTRVDSIVMHTTEINLSGTIDIFENRLNSVSSHYVIDGGGAIYPMVELEDSAYHATYYNSRSIGIE